jgi:hypothetical protein
MAGPPGMDALRRPAVAPRSLARARPIPHLGGSRGVAGGNHMQQIVDLACVTLAGPPPLAGPKRALRARRNAPDATDA